MILFPALELLLVTARLIFFLPLLGVIFALVPLLYGLYLRFEHGVQGHGVLHSPRGYHFSELTVSV